MFRMVFGVFLLVVILGAAVGTGGAGPSDPLLQVHGDIVRSVAALRQQLQDASARRQQEAGCCGDNRIADWLSTP